MSKLNYDAQVSDTIDARAPFVVQVDPNKPPGDRFADFKPGKSTSSVVAHRADETVRRKNFMRPPVARYEEDYIAPIDAAVKRNNEKGEILRIAKEIYSQETIRRNTYLAAQKTVEAASVVEKDAPSPELARAMKIVARIGKPLTKTEAMEKAAKQFYGLRN